MFDPLTESLLDQCLLAQPQLAPAPALAPLPPEQVREILKPDDEHQSEAI